jgi:hypothetical protein
MDYNLQPFDPHELSRLIGNLEATLVDKPRLLIFPGRLRVQLIDTKPPVLTTSTLKELAKWCKTDGQYAEGGDIARKISLLLFGRLVDRDALRV